MAYQHSQPKVAIPKLDRGLPPPPKIPTHHREDRAARACKTCRKRKVKCSGDVPRCANCHANGLDCVYEQARRDRLKQATELNQTLATLFTELSGRLGEDDRKRFQDVIDAAEDDMFSPQAGASVGSLGKRARKPSVAASLDHNSPSQTHGEAYVTASVGSNDDLDFLDEDLLRTRKSRETGYVGQNSEVQWLRSVQLHAQSNESEPYGLPYGPPGSSDHAFEQRSQARHQRTQAGSGTVRHVTDATFYLDSDDIDLDIVVNPYELPDPEIAEQLLNCYMSTIHSSFPIVPPSFEDQVRRFIVSLKQNRGFQVPDRWRALMNLIFAIGAKYSHLTDTEWRGDERDHLVYMTRASHLLGMNNTSMLISEPNLSLVQASAVFSLYFLVIGHVSRAWLMIGISTRFALALGLHLRNEDPEASITKKEMLLRTWWSLHSIECLVSSITGRPPTISSEDCTVPLPRTLETRPHSKRRPSSHESQKPRDASSEISSFGDADRYLVGTINISILTQRVLTGLYAPRTAIRSWQDVQESIKELLQELDAWSNNALHAAVSLDGPQQQREVERERLILQMQYWSTRILITRPCLCRTERRIKNESDRSASFNSEMASVCVASARNLTALLPRQPDLNFIYTKAPWWNVVHLIMQCAAVLLLETAYQNQHTRDDSAEVTADIRKLIDWLHTMQPKDPVADRAYRVLRRILQNVAPALQSKAVELLADDEIGKSVNERLYKPFVTPLSQQQYSANWAQGQLYDGSESFTGHRYDTQGENHANQDTSQPLFEHLPCTTFSMPDIPRNSTFGNPFINSWDEGQPVVGMQDLWYDTNSSFANIPEDLDGMNLLQSYVNQQRHQQPLGTEEYSSSTEQQQQSRRE